MRTPAYARPDDEPAPAAPAGPEQPEPAIGYFEGTPTNASPRVLDCSAG